MGEIIEGTAGPDLLGGTIEADFISGGEGNDTIRGDGYAPGISGAGRGPDVYLGGDDAIAGGEGDDAIAGGHGADRLWGGPGADRFVYGTHIPVDPFLGAGPDIFALDTGVGPGQRDVIEDFEPGADVIDLSALLTLRYRHLDIDEAYRFVGTAPFSGQGPEVRFAAEEGRTVVQLDGRAFLSGEVVGVDGQPDGEIELAGEFALLTTDFIL